MHEDEQLVDPSELPPDFSDSSSESDSEGGSDCIALASDAETFVESDSHDEHNVEEGVDLGETYSSDSD